MTGLFDGTKWERPVSCGRCARPRSECACPRDAAGRILLPADQPLRVSREKRRSGKVMTVVRGLDPAASDATAILSRLKRQCAAGGTIADGSIEIQGDQRERVVAILREMGYPARAVGG